jgi:serine/threonine protein kinase
MYSPPSDDGVTFGWDVWSCGIILYALANYRLPFTKAEILQKRNLLLYIPPEFTDGMSVVSGSDRQIERERMNVFFHEMIRISFDGFSEYAELLVMMLNDCQEERISMKQVLQSQWCVFQNDSNSPAEPTSLSSTSSSLPQSSSTLANKSTALLPKV